MPLFPVSLQKEKELLNRMRRWGIREADLEETFVRSSGAGGQKVNKSSTCVILYHNPTKIKVKCQIARTQGMNRFLARRILLEKIEGQVLGGKSSEQQKKEKIRRQKRRRSRKAKERVLKDKKHQSNKKNLRLSVQNPD